MSPEMVGVTAVMVATAVSTAPETEPGLPCSFGSPDLQEEAVKTVLAQAELLCAEWV